MKNTMNTAPCVITTIPTGTPEPTSLKEEFDRVQKQLDKKETERLAKLTE
jgi:hypothetical protein